MDQEASKKGVSLGSGCKPSGACRHTWALSKKNEAAVICQQLSSVQCSPFLDYFHQLLMTASSTGKHLRLFKIPASPHLPSLTSPTRDGEEFIQKVPEKFVLQERSQPGRIGGEGCGQEWGTEEEVSFLEVQEKVEERPCLRDPG